MTIYGWIACHLDSKVKPLLLYYSIESLLINGVDGIYVSIYILSRLNYIDIKTHLKPLEDKFPKQRIIIYNSDEKLSQFDHLACIYKNFDGAPSDKILFFDDDDVLIRMPDHNKYSIILGIGYEIEDCEEDEYLSYSAIKAKLIEEDKCKINYSINSFRRILDFGGSICPYSYLKKYFEIRDPKIISPEDSPRIKLMKNRINDLEDGKFISYFTELNPYIHEKPYYYHRLWIAQDRKTSTWKIPIM